MKYYPLVIGCQMNYADAERLADLLQTHGCQPVAQEEAADLIIVLACSVRQKAMDRIFGKLGTWRQRRKERAVKTILTGCVLPADRKKLRKEFDVILEIKNIGKLPQLLGLTKKKITAWPVTNADYLALKPAHRSLFQAYVPIMTGCNNYCTYCAVPYTRGQETSRPSSEIISEVKSLVKKGYKEITLLGQNVNAYIDPAKRHRQDVLAARSPDLWRFKKDQPIMWRTATTEMPKDFAELLKKINALPGDFWLEFLTSNPQDMSEELINILPKLKKVTPYLHLPFQAGSNEILRRMNRRHTIEYYLHLVKKIRQRWPDVAISTDIIVGFPGETKAQFMQTARVMRLVKFDMAYLSEYSPRPGTAAQRFFPDNVSLKEKIRRKNFLNRILTKTALAHNRQLINKKAKVLVENYNPETQTNSGKTGTFKTVKFHGQDLTGQFAEVKIMQATAWGLAGKEIKTARKK